VSPPGQKKTPPRWLSLALEAGQLLERKRLDDAVIRAEESLRLNPDGGFAYFVLGMVSWHRGRLEQATEHLRRAIAIRPDLAGAHHGLGMCLAHAGDHDGALRHYDLALIIQPDFPQVRFRRAAELLRRGRYADGWVDYESRWAATQMTRPDIPRPKWDGSPLNGRSLLVHTEQGVGDVLMFLRFLSRIKRGPGDRLVFACQTALQPLLRTVPWVDEWFPIDVHGPVTFDTYIPMLSLPGVLHLSAADIPFPAPYITADAARVESWRPRVATLPGIKVGVCWQGSPTFLMDPFRSIPLSHFAPLAAVPGVTLVSLQKGPGEDQIEANRAAVPLAVFPELDAFEPFLDTAAVMQHLDLVISADTAIAHLAGALGRPVWLVLGTDCDWRWGADRSETPWYATARLFRQKRFADWPGVVAEMAAALAAGPAARAAPPIPAAECRVPVSAGELIDKITILEIKLDRIRDAGKRANVRRELDLLRAARAESLPSSPELVALTAELRAINQRLWDIENGVRDCDAAGDFGDRFVALARSVYAANDERAALKRRINALLGSTIVEEKSYARDA
jgi:Family of unknown function (DUF6165)/Tetratricopeptide repeat/Glycosyltransferase family 9 (heptosyltransferase)